MWRANLSYQVWTEPACLFTFSLSPPSPPSPFLPFLPLLLLLPLLFSLSSSFSTDWCHWRHTPLLLTATSLCGDQGRRWRVSWGREELWECSTSMPHQASRCGEGEGGLLFPSRNHPLLLCTCYNDCYTCIQIQALSAFATDCISLHKIWADTRPTWPVECVLYSKTLHSHSSHLTCRAGLGRVWYCGNCRLHYYR